VEKSSLYHSKWISFLQTLVLRGCFKIAFKRGFYDFLPQYLAENGAESIHSAQFEPDIRVEKGKFPAQMNFQTLS